MQITCTENSIWRHYQEIPSSFLQFREQIKAPGQKSIGHSRTTWTLGPKMSCGVISLQKGSECLINDTQERELSWLISKDCFTLSQSHVPDSSVTLPSPSLSDRHHALTKTIPPSHGSFKEEYSQELKHITDIYEENILAF